jgi:hypothetical protein
MQPYFAVKLFNGFGESSRDIDVFPHLFELLFDDHLRRRREPVCVFNSHHA